MKSFPEKIKEARSALSMSQETLAEKVGASRRSIIAYEKGDKHLSLIHISEPTRPY